MSRWMMRSCKGTHGIRLCQVQIMCVFVTHSSQMVQADAQLPHVEFDVENVVGIAELLPEVEKCFRHHPEDHREPGLLSGCEREECAFSMDICGG
jgi:hypothetical protein